MVSLNPWINFNGNAEEAFTFYKSVFGGELTKLVRFKDLSSPEFPVLEKDENAILKIELSIGNNKLIANDVPQSMGKVNENENRSKLLIRAESRQEADAIFSGLSEGAIIEAPIGDSPWGSYYGSLRDKYGVEWMIEFINK